MGQRQICAALVLASLGPVACHGAGSNAGAGAGAEAGGSPSGVDAASSVARDGSSGPGNSTPSPGVDSASAPAPATDANGGNPAGTPRDGGVPPAGNAAPIPALTFEAARTTFFDLMSAAYSYVEPRGVNSSAPGRYTRWTSGNDPELITRMMESMGAWLSRPARPAQVTTGRGVLDVEEMMRKALANGTDPASGVTWETLTQGQLDVESASIAWGTYLAGARVLSKLTAAQRTNLQTWLLDHSNADVNQNWVLFYAVTNAFLKSQGWPFNATALATMLTRADSFYKGNGWYTDGATHVFDDYNSTVFATHLAEFAIMDGQNDPARRTAIMTRLRQYLLDQPYFFGTEGRHPEFGRSTSYKMARLTALILAYYVDQTFNTPTGWNLGFKVVPEQLTPGMLRRLIRQHLNWYLSNGAFDPATGLLIQRVTGTGSIDIAEDYISPGSVYWAMRPLGALMLLSDTDPLWSVDEQPLPVETGDFNRWLPTPGFLLSGNKASGDVVLFNAGTTFSTAHVEEYILKYGKFAYSSGMGFVVSRQAQTWRNPDNAIQIGVGGQWGHREEPGPFASQANAATSAVVSMKHRQISGGQSFDVRTLLFVKNDFHVRVHKVTPIGFTGTYLVREGGFAIGKRSATDGTTTRDPNGAWAYGAGVEGAGMVGALRTYNRVDTDLPAGEKREGAAAAHTRFGYYVLPFVSTSSPQTGEITVAVMVRGSPLAFDAATTYATVSSLVVDATRGTISFADGSTLTGTFLD
jgi:hypothetical protein